MTKPLLIEIGVEELPAIPLLKELKNIEKKYLSILEKYALVCDFEFYYTPRRLVFWHREFKSTQDDTIEEFFGAPLEIAYKDSKPTPAALGFAKKCQVDISKISTAKKDNKDVLYFKKELKGKDSKELIPTIIKEFISILDFGKSMRWADFDESFIRPIRWLNIMLDDTLVEMELFGIKSNKSTFVHRTSNFNAIILNNIKEYFELLSSSGVVLFADKRREIILNQIANIEKQESIQVDIDAQLLDEVVAITEYPTALLGSFEEEFLTLPSEVIITSMKENQRYFAVFNKEQKLLNRFIVVTNALSDNFSNIISGNERVLRPRLHDAMFFYNNDLKRGLSCDGLEKIVFMQGLGTVLDKVLREEMVAQKLHELYRPVDAKIEDLQRAIRLAKADLNTQMVYEFTELQGIIGGYYATILGENSSVALAIKEQYLPNKEGGSLPSTPLSALVAMSIKLDTLMALFSIDQIPTGSRDPFALRRTVNGIVRICQTYNFEFDIIKTFEVLSSIYKPFDRAKLEEFFIERLRNYFSVNPSIVEAVLLSGDREILSIIKKVEALSYITQSDGFSSYFSIFKRVANITKDVNLNSTLDIKSELFEHDSERDLFKKYSTIVAKKYNSYEEELDALFSLSGELDNFFNSVMVNAENLAVRENRKVLIATIYKSILSIADIKEIAI